MVIGFDHVFKQGIFLNSIGLVKKPVTFFPYRDSSGT